MRRLVQLIPYIVCFVIAFCVGRLTSLSSPPTLYEAAAAAGSSLQTEAGIEFDMRLRSDLRSLIARWFAEAPMEKVTYGEWIFYVREGSSSPSESEVVLATCEIAVRDSAPSQVQLIGKLQSIPERLSGR